MWATLQNYILLHFTDHASSPWPPLPPLFSLPYRKKCSRNKSHKVSGWKQAHVGMEPSKTNRTRWEWHYNTFTPFLHLVPFWQLRTPQNSPHAHWPIHTKEMHNYTPTRYSALLTQQPFTCKTTICTMFSRNKSSQLNWHSNMPYKTQHLSCTPQLLHTRQTTSAMPNQ